MNEKRYVVVIDGGGTKSQLDIYNESMEVECSIKGLFANFSVDASTSRTHLEQLLDQANLKIPSVMWKRVVLGVSGIQTYPSIDSLKQQLTETYSTSISIITDLELAKYAYLHEDGLLVIAGTGSVAIGKRLGQTLSVGGWGHILGDEGSAYSLSIRYLKQLIQRYDAGLKLTQTDTDIIQFLEISDVQSLKQVVYSGSKDRVAAISKKLSEHLIHEEVKNIFIDEARSFANQVNHLVRRLGFDRQVPVKFMGSLLESSVLFKDSFVEALMQEGYSVIENISSTQVTMGGYYLDKELM